MKVFAFSRRQSCLLLKSASVAAFSFTLIFTSSILGDQTRQGISDGDFESGQGQGYWSMGYYSGGATTSAGIVNFGNAYQGQWYAYLGDETPSDSDAYGYLYQFIQPSPASDETYITVSYYINITSSDTSGVAHDHLKTVLRFFDSSENYLNDVIVLQHDNTGRDPNNVKNNYNAASATYSFPNHNFGYVMLIFIVDTDGTYPTTFRIDNVSVLVGKPDQYTVTPSAGQNGAINPSSNQTVTSGGSVSFTATPNTDYDVDTWYVNNTAVQTGGTSFTLNNVTASDTVLVTFTPTTFALNVTAANGSVTKTPDQTRYAIGTQVTLTPTPAAGYMFTGWTGDYTGIGNPLVITMNSDESLSAQFIKVPNAVTLGYSIGGDDPVTGNQTVTVNAPALDLGYLLVMLISHDAINWLKYDAIPSDGTAKNNWAVPSFPGPGKTLCQLEIIPTPNEPAFLQFPIQGSSDPYSQLISAIFDLDSDIPGRIRTYRNEIGTSDYAVTSTQSSSLIGFKKDAVGTDFDLRYNYDDGTHHKSILWYDDHHGYDYPCDLATPIVACAGGVVDRAESNTQAEWNGLCILHDNGYRTYYLHLSAWSDKISQNYNGSSEIRVSQGEIIGYAGNTGVPGAQGSTDYVHLHLTVKSPAKKRLDPYGEFSCTGVKVQNPLWISPAPTP